MRTIKFRAWDKEYEKMTYFDDEDYEYKPPLVFRLDQVFKKNSNYDDYEDFEYNDITDKVEIMQFTGLHDKNGKEIYEGDIVNMHYFFENYDPSTLGAFEDEAEETGIIKINEYGVYLENKKREIFYLVNYVQEPEEELEVLGNIYKNKELLNETNR